MLTKLPFFRRSTHLNGIYTKWENSLQQSIPIFTALKYKEYWGGCLSTGMHLCKSFGPFQKRKSPDNNTTYTWCHISFPTHYISLHKLQLRYFIIHNSIDKGKNTPTSQKMKVSTIFLYDHWCWFSTKRAVRSFNNRTYKCMSSERALNNQRFG